MDLFFGIFGVEKGGLLWFMPVIFCKETHCQGQCHACAESALRLRNRVSI